ncbi:MAG TPA: glycoside hydrolase family 31 protein [Kiritimatiellia bacterium]|nr:glycoside hydrolase family 31 protein [Kiritimatiellia bacterium]
MIPSIRRSLAVLFVFPFLWMSPPSVQAWTADEVDFPGTWNGWQLDTPTFKYNGPDGFSEWFRMYAVLTNNINPFEFKMVTGKNWAQNYGGNAAFQKNTWDNMWYQPTLPLPDGNSTLVGGGLAGMRYIFTVKDPGFSDTFISVQEISKDPIEIASVTGPSGAGYPPGGTVDVRMTLSDEPAPEERFYVRYTLDNFATYGIAGSTVALETNLSFSLGGSVQTQINWVATAQMTNLVGNVTYQWYAFSSTASKSHLEVAGGVGVDALTLAWDNNQGNNFQFSTFGPIIVGAATNWFHDTSGGTNRLVFEFGPGQGVAEVVAYAEDMVRVRWHWDGLYEKDDVGIDRTVQDFPAFGVNVSSVGNLAIMDLPKIRVEVHTSPTFKVDVKNANGDYLLRGHRFEFEPAYDPVIDSTYDNLRYTHILPVGYKVKAIMQSPADDAYFGLGSEARSLNRRGRDLQMWNSDTFSWEEHWNPMYNSFPFFYGIRSQTNLGYGLFFNNPARPVFRFGTQIIDGNSNQHYSFEAADGQIDYFVIGGGDDHRMPEILTRYSELTGLPIFLPKWSLGYQQCRWSYHRQSWIEWLTDQFLAYEFPLDVLYLDLDYFDQGDPTDIDYTGSSQLHQLIFNSGGDAQGPYWPDVPGMINYTRERGVQLVAMVEPWINTTDPKWPEAASQLHFVELIESQFTSTQAITPIFFGNVSWIDFTSTGARNWWRGKVLDFLNQYPFEGIWNDLNEPADAETLPRNALYYMDERFGLDNFDSRRWHVNVKNTYNVYECSLTYEIMREKHPDRRPVVISRAGWPGIQKYALSWSGDNRADWDSNRYNIRLGNSVMISGQVNFGHDLGGFTDETSPELLTRWTQWGAFNPLMRNHSMKVFAEREPWQPQFQPNYFEWMRDITRFRYRLMPFLYTLQWESSVNGLPMNAPTVFFFQDDPNTFIHNETEISVTDKMLVAPMFVQGAVDRTLYLPDAGSWYYWPTGDKYDGGQFVNVPAPMAVQPLFVREGAIIPMGPWMQSVYQFQPSWLELRVWPSATPSEFLLYEDDGLTMAYTNGVFAKTLFQSVVDAGGWTFDIGETVGSFNTYTGGVRTLLVMGHDMPMVDEVTSNGQPLPRYGDAFVLRNASGEGWAYNTVDGSLLIKVDETGATNRLEAAFRPAWSPTPYPVFTSNFDQMAIAGTFNLWNTAARNMKLVDNYVWAGVVSITNASNVRFKFAANDTWDNRWGDGGQGSTVVPFFETGSAGGDSGSDILVNGVMNGLYTFRFNEVTLEYSVQFAGDADSDGDGIPDSWEVAFGLNPLNAFDADDDLNNDGLSNVLNYLLNGNPLLVDTDGDGYSDLEEAIAGTALDDPDAVFTWSGADAAQGLLWPGLTGRVYDVFYRTSLVESAPWVLLPQGTNVPGLSGGMNLMDADPADPIRVYRLGVELEP